MPRYVILRHETPPASSRPSHWDFMFECGDVLRTWALLELPTQNVVVEAERLADHRRAYLQYEGPLSANRGSVSRWDEGEFSITCDRPLEWKVQMSGRRLVGQLSLTAADERTGNWVARFTVD